MPGDVHRYVLPDERVVLAVRRHWAKVAEPVVTTAAAFVLVGWAVPLAEVEVGRGARLLWWAWGALLVRLLWRLVDWRTEWFVATDRRMLLLQGLVTRSVAMMPLGKVTDMSYSRTVPGRVLGYGTFVLESAGQDQAMRTISWVARPDETYRDLCATIFASPPPPTVVVDLPPARRPRQRRPEPVSAPGPAPSPGPRPEHEPRNAPTQPLPARVVPGRPASEHDAERPWHVSVEPSRHVRLDDPHDD